MSFLHFWLPIIAFLLGIILNTILNYLIFKWFFLPLLRGGKDE